MVIKKIFAFVVCLFSASAAWAEENNYTMGETIVTESKIPQSEENVTQKFDVLLQNQIEGATYTNRNITEIFTYMPGTFIDVLSRNDANWGSYGALGPKYSVYMLDGLPIDSFVDPMSLEPWILQRAEVHRGPASVMYPNYMTMDFSGNETALAGITNLVLKDKIETPLSRIQLGYGSYKTLNNKLYSQGNKGNLHYFMGTSYEQSDYINYGTDPSWLNMIDDPEYKKTKLYFKTTYFIEPATESLSLFAHHTQHTGDAGRPNRGYNHIYDTINAAYTKQISEVLNVQAKGGFRYYERIWEEDNYTTDLSIRETDGVVQNIFPFDLAFNLRHSGDDQLTFGADFQNATYETFAEVDGVRSKGNDVIAQNYGLYVQEKIIMDKWVVRAGGRYNNTRHNYDRISGATPGEDSKSWGEFLWSGGARYNASAALSLYTNIGKSFVVPSAKSVGGTIPIGDTTSSGQVPNPDLKPETGLGYDVGAEFALPRGLFLGIRGFYNAVDDAILESVVSANQTQSVNAGKATSYGAELEAQQMLTRSLSWFANYTYTSTELDNPLDADQDGADVTFVPDYMANLGMTAVFPGGITASPYLRTVGEYFDSTSKSGRKPLGEYTIVNLSARMPLGSWSGYGTHLNLDLYNLTNEKYEMPFQFQDPGFNAMASVEILM